MEHEGTLSLFHKQFSTRVEPCAPYREVGEGAYLAWFNQQSLPQFIPLQFVSMNYDVFGGPVLALLQSGVYSRRAGLADIGKIHTLETSATAALLAVILYIRDGPPRRDVFVSFFHYSVCISSCFGFRHLSLLYSLMRSPTRHT